MVIYSPPKKAREIHTQTHKLTHVHPYSTASLIMVSNLSIFLSGIMIIVIHSYNKLASILKKINLLVHNLRIFNPCSFFVYSLYYSRKNIRLTFIAFQYNGLKFEIYKYQWHIKHSELILKSWFRLCCPFVMFIMGICGITN